MNALLGESVSATHYGNEPISSTAVGPILSTPPPPEPSREDDSADVYPGREAKLISPEIASAETSSWSRAEKHPFTSWIAEDFSTPTDPLFSPEQINKTREASLSESLQTTLQNVLEISQRPYNIHSMPGWASSMWNEVGKHYVWHQSTEHISEEFINASFSLEQSSKNAKEEDIPAPLADALRDLHEINDEADEEGISPPSETAIANSDRLIRAIYDIVPRQYLVELLPEGVIAITIPGGFRCSVMLLCESAGGVLCSVNMNGEHRRKRYPHAYQLPDKFMREALSELGRE